MEKFIFNTRTVLIFFLCLLPAVSSHVFSQAVADSASNPNTITNTPSSQDPSAKTSVPAAQESHSAVTMEFVKEKTEQGPDSIYFNILKVTNNNGAPIRGMVNITVPQGWRIISEERTPVNISPGNTEYIPIRVSMARTATGGVSYLVNAALVADRSIFPGKNQTSISKACYITVPQIRRWDVYPVLRTVYIDRYSTHTPLKLRMSNRGNGTEVVKLDFEIGSALSFVGTLGNRYFTSVELKPHSDTVVSFPVKYAPPDQPEIWNRDFKKLNVRITATVDTIVKRASVNFKHLESIYQNVLYGKVTPLNIEVQMQNLLSSASPSTLVNAYGVIMLKNDDIVDYNVRFLNIIIGSYDNTADVFEKLWRYSRMLASYRSKRWEIAAGDIYSYGSAFFGVVGRGVGGKYDINADNTVGGAFTAAIGSPMYSGTIFHETVLNKKIAFRSSLNAILDNNNRLNTYGASAQVNFAFLPGQSIYFLVASSLTQHNYTNQTFVDANGNFIITDNPGANRLGFASQIGYQLNRNRITSSVNVLFATKDFYQYYSGKVNVNGSAQYILTKKYSLLGTTAVFLQDPKMYSRGVLSPANKYLSGMHRLEIAGRMTSRLTLYAGPVLEHLSASAIKVNSLTGVATNTYFNTISPKLSMRCSYKNNLSGFVNPYALVGYTFITSAFDTTVAISPLHIPKNTFFNAKVGLNVIQSNWGVNVFYYLGPRDFVTQSDYYYFGRYSKSIRIMPFFQKYYFNKALLLSSYNSYYYEVLSNSERISLNARLKFFLGRDWELFVDNNLFLSSVINSEGEKTYTRSYFLNVGVKKSFDIPQPRVKYYDLRIVCFKDINGNKIKDDNEYGLSDIVISVDRAAQADSAILNNVTEPGQFAPAEMVTDNFGQVVYSRIPEGKFDIRVFPLMNLVDMYNANGQNQKVEVFRDTTYYIPFVQSYLVTGRIILNRDEFSSLGVVSPGNVRIVAVDSLGNSFPTLSNADGSFTLYVPRSGDYKVMVNNVFGEQFIQEEMEYVVAFNGAKEFQVDFVFNEKKRSVNINGASTSVDTLLGRTLSGFIVAGRDTLKNATIVTDTAGLAAGGVKDKTKQLDSPIPVGPGISYRVQLRSSPYKIPASQYATVFRGIKDIYEYYEGGNYKYTVGELKTLADAKKLKAELRAKGFSDSFMVPFYKGNRVRY